MSLPTPHSPLGADASFDFGPAGARAGVRLPAGTVKPFDVLVGCRASGAEPWSLLPFFTPVPGGPAPLPKGRFGRFLALAGDKWMIGPLVFKLCTPFSAPEQEADDKFRYAPLVTGYLEYDNSHSNDTAELLFGLCVSGVDSSSPSAVGFEFGQAYGFVTAPSPEVHARRNQNVFGAEIGDASALHFVVPPQSKRIFPLVFGFFAPGYHYARYFPDLAAVLAYGLSGHSRYVAASDARDAEFMRSTLPFDTKTRAALEVRDWLSRSRRRAGDPEVDLAPLRPIGLVG